jgi:hypothetical protein
VPIAPSRIRIRSLRSVLMSVMSDTSMGDLPSGPVGDHTGTIAEPASYDRLP